MRRHPLAAVMVLGVALRLGFVLLGSGSARFQFADTESYLLVADALPRALWSPPTELIGSTLWRTPVYPAFVALTGGTLALGWTIVAQCLLGGAVNVWLAHRLGRSVFGTRAALIAAVLCALDPVSIAHSLLIATEVLTATWLLLLLIGARAVLDRLRDDGPVLLLAGATGLGGAVLTLTRPNLLLLAPAAALVVVLAARSRRGWAAGALLLLAALVPVAGWVARNDAVAGSPVLTTVSGQNLVDFGLAAAAHDEGLLPFWSTDHATTSAAALRSAEADRVSPAVDGYTESAATNEQWTREGRAILLDHPKGAATVVLATTVKAGVAPGTNLLEPHLPSGAWSVLSAPLAVAGVGFLAVLYAGAAGGVADLVCRRGWADLSLLAGGVGLAVLCSVGPWMYVRFRVPVLPIVAVLAGGGIELLRATIRRDRSADATPEPATS